MVDAEPNKRLQRTRDESKDKMLSEPRQERRAAPKAPTIFFAASLLLMAATIVFSNVLCSVGCRLMPLRLWYWAGPIKLSGVLVVAAALLMSRHPLAYLAAIVLSAYAVYDVSLGVYETWRSSGTSLEMVLRESLLPLWRGLIRGGLGILFVTYGSMRLFRYASGRRTAIHNVGG